MGARSVPEQRHSRRPHQPGRAADLSQYFLRPNTSPTTGDPWRNNFVFAPNLADDTFHNYATKVDQNISSRKPRCSSATPTTSARKTRFTNGITSGPAQDGQLPLERVNNGRRRLGPHDQLVAGAERPRRLEPVPRAGALRSRAGLQPAELGFPSALVNQLPNQVFPRINLSITTGCGTTDYQGLGRVSRNSETTTGFSLQPNFSWTDGQSHVRGGLDMRHTWYTREINSNLFRLDFDRRFTQRAFNTGDALSGNALASFLLGAASRRRHRQQLLPDVPLELLRALGPGRLEDRPIA